MPKPIFLHGLEIKGFRPFAHLTLPELSRVNLIVGKNSCGKTSLLEAIQLFVAEGAVFNIRDLLSSRNEISAERRGEAEAGQMIGDNLAYEALFFGRPDLDLERPELSIASLGPDATILHVAYCRFIEKIEDSDGQARRRIIIVEREDAAEGSPAALQVKVGDRERLVPIEIVDRSRRVSRRDLDSPFPFQYVPADGLSSNDIARGWDKVTLTAEEGIIYSALRLVSADIERVAFVADTRTPYNRYGMTKVSGQSKPIPLRSLGEGVNHLLGIAVSLIAARDGLLLVDEIENGLHYSVMTRMWKLILDQSRALNVQVFAATHSLDCIRGFQAATAELGFGDARLIRLEGKSGNIEGVSFDPAELRIVTEEDIEVR
jgi:predicted ATPase